MNFNYTFRLFYNDKEMNKKDCKSCDWVATAKSDTEAQEKAKEIAKTFEEQNKYKNLKVLFININKFVCSVCSL